MPINKFGTSLGKSGAEPYYQCSGLLRNFMRDNALSMDAAKLIKIYKYTYYITLYNIIHKYIKIYKYIINNYKLYIIIKYI